MTPQQAIAKIKEIGFAANLWEKAGMQRIYLEYNFKGSKKEAGFIGSDKTDLKSVILGGDDYKQKWNVKLQEVAELKISWNEKPKTQAKEVWGPYSKESWEYTHNL